MRDPVVPSVEAPNPTLRQDAQGIGTLDVDARRNRIVVTFLRAIADGEGRIDHRLAYLLDRRSYSLSGGVSVQPRILRAELYDPEGSSADLRGRRVLLEIDRPGDSSIYRLTVSGPTVDPLFGSRPLQFGLIADAPLDCRPTEAGSEGAREAVAIDYLAKDYASFRQALLEFIPTRLPAWIERSEADLGIMLLELFSAAADELSYMQDRVANEAFLSSATQRRSVARHLALLGYELDEGAAAYTWLRFKVPELTPITSEPGLRACSNPGRPPQLALGAGRLARNVLQLDGSGSVVVFEPIVDSVLRPEHNQMKIYDWGDTDSFLPETALSAALEGAFPSLGRGDYVLFFDDQRGHRDVVRLTAPARVVEADPIRARPDGPITVLTWSESTPLHWRYATHTSAACGNLVLATHGETVTEELRSAGAPPVEEIASAGFRIRLKLSYAPLTHLDGRTLALAAPPRGDLVPVAASTLRLEVDGEPWQQRPTLLDSGPDDLVFTLEIDDGGAATVVFGDGVFGRPPDGGSAITATYRVGQGAAGNQGPDTLTTLRPRPGEDVSGLAVTNPLPALGGRDLESREHARRFGPAQVQQSLVAVSAADYVNALLDFVDVHGRKPVMRARVAFPWTGSWQSARVLVETSARTPLSPALRGTLQTVIEGRLLAGYGLEILGPRYVGVDVAIVCQVLDGFRRADVLQRLRRALGTTSRVVGASGFFDPYNFGFGDALEVTRLLATVMAVPGVEGARVTRLSRSGAPNSNRETRLNLSRGHLPVAEDEIIRLDNDPAQPQHGTLDLQLEGDGQ
jgi:hypothetical protein